MHISCVQSEKKVENVALESLKMNHLEHHLRETYTIKFGTNSNYEVLHIRFCVKSFKFVESSNYIC